MKDFTRRQALAAASVLTALPLLSLTSRQTVAGDPPQLDPNDAPASALGYIHRSPRTDNVCANCELYTGSADAEWGPRAIFPGKQVAASSWCSAWVKQAG